MQPEYMTRLFDPAGNAARQTASWRIGQEATITKNGTDYLPIEVKIERSSRFPPGEPTILGGFCSLFTGDLSLGRPNQDLAVSLVRMDQITETVGTTKTYPKAIVIEDTFFNRLTGIPLPRLQRQADEAIKRVSRWLDISSGNSQRLIVIKTSDVSVEKELRSAAKYLASEVLRNPNFARIQAAPILVMYTSLWPQILKSLGYIDTVFNIVVEPVIHFIDDRNFPELSLQNAYLDFLDWLKANPYGRPRSANQQLGIAGFLETYEGPQTKRRTRLLPFDQVPNTKNVFDWIKQISEVSLQFPFPLRNSPIFAAGINYAFWNPEAAEALQGLALLEDEYYRIRQQTPKAVRSEAWSASLKQDVQNQALPLSRTVSAIVSDTLIQVLGA